jgi:hypothetical protein
MTAAWQVDFHIVPKRALASAPQPLSREVLDDTDWWTSAQFPADYGARLATVAPPSHARDPELATWGSRDGNRVDVLSRDGHVSRVIARVDVRKLDSKFGAALLVFVRGVNGLLIRIDGLVVEPTINAYVASLRSSAAWRYASDPAEFLASRAAIEDDSE